MWIVEWSDDRLHSVFTDWAKAVAAAVEVAGRQGVRPRVLSETSWRKVTS